MNTFEFISQLLSHLAWPVTVLILAFVLRKNIGDLLSSLTRLKYKDLEVDFRRLAESAGKLPPSRPTISPVSDTDRAIYSSFENQIKDVAELAPSATILLAWTGVATAASSAVARMAISPEPPQLRSPMHNLEQLRKYADLPQEVASTINEMRILRNKVAHDEKQRLKISPDSALSYGETAIRIIDYLNGLGCLGNTSSRS